MQAAEARLAHLTCSRMVESMFLQTALVACCWSGPEVSSRVTRTLLLGCLEVGKVLTGLDQCRTLQALRVEGSSCLGPVCVSLQSSSEKVPLTHSWEQKEATCLSPGPWIVSAACSSYRDWKPISTLEGRRQIKSQLSPSAWGRRKRLLHATSAVPRQHKCCPSLPKSQPLPEEG